MAWLKRTGTKAGRDAMARYAIPSDNAFGVPVGVLKKESKRIGKDHELAAALWKTGKYEARMLATMVDDPARVTAAQMDRCCGEFDNWAIVDTACFHLFDKTAEAWSRLAPWSKKRDEFGKRAAFALLWSLSVHDKRAGDDLFLKGLRLIERESGDERNFVKKGVNMALRAVGKRNAALHAAAMETAKRLAASENAAARWNGKDALRALASRKPVRK
jgi:3-methyladenine DNA glycosylase AlkD